MKRNILLCCLLFSVNCFSQLNIVPIPASIKINKGSFLFSSSTVIVIKNGVDDYSADLFNTYLKAKFGYKLKKVKAALKNYIQLTTVQTLVPGKEGAYSLNINSKSITIYGQPVSGTFYGLQTLMQLLPAEAKKSFRPVYNITALEITDEPRFKYRGMHLDVARHFMPVDFIKKYIDYLAAYKFNTFHWHLTDDQGWRIEIKKYPLLTSVGGYRNGTITGRYPGKGNTNTKHGGFYTQQQIKEIIKYAADRFITVIPEIEMPGHASAAIAAYPELSCFPNEDTQIAKDCIWSGPTKGKQVQQTWGVFEDVFTPTDYTFNFLQNVLDEVIVLFPSKYIHIGGDECPKEAWKRSAFCQQLIKEKNLKDEHGLQSYFIQRIEKYINGKGKKIIGWDEILEGGLAPNSTVMSWRGEEGGIEAAKQNHDVIMTPGSHCYFDHSQSKNEDSVTIGGYLPLETVYIYEPIPAVLNAEQAKHVLGAQGNLWTEYINNTSKVEYMIFPRMMALSEVLWSPKEKRNWNDFERRLPALLERLEKNGINYSTAYYEPKVIIESREKNDGIFWTIRNETKLPAYKFFNLANKKILFGYGKSESAFNDSVMHGDGNFYCTITESGTYRLVYYNYKSTIGRGMTLIPDYSKSISDITQKFSFNKATGKKITIVNPPSKSYPGDGAFTLVNGVQNEKGLAKSSEFLGFNGTDLDVTIDLGAVTEVKNVILHTLEQQGSWIYPPSKVEVTYLLAADTDKRGMLGPTKMTSVDVQQGKGINKIEIPGTQSCRYVRVVAKNFGIIPSGNPGAGNPAWLFVDEIEVN
ncbi:beta-N-acetylhexosaminidase [Ferruginibacter sp.]|nr:beta-N-acetylhexosaminidase [Ferruginibacter sp.]